MSVDKDKIKRLTYELLEAIGEDPTRQGLVDTPRRVANWWQEFVDYEPGRTDTAFSLVDTDQMVVVTGIRVHSLCEHHMLPFWCDLTIGYIATTKVLGLSKFGRIAHQFAHGLQIQERLVQLIADEVSRLADTPHVAVLGRGEHLCMTMRGIKTQAEMISSVMRGAFADNATTRQEFMSLAKKA